jgi:hypothetical protein
VVLTTGTILSVSTLFVSSSIIDIDSRSSSTSLFTSDNVSGTTDIAARSSCVFAGELVAGDRVAGDRVAGDDFTAASELVASELVASELVAGELVAGDDFTVAVNLGDAFTIGVKPFACGDIVCGVVRITEYGDVFAVSFVSGVLDA